MTLFKTIFTRDCLFLDIYNWDNSLEKKEDAIKAVREVIRQWPAREQGWNARASQ
ncbi:MAG TPA: hypothetical protein VNQ80_06830 [Parapedobacter sp.]|uniref:hypothetical protein n=1 Tax=Parapedobacter sp. TaxID=1958893 RepID=UPI002C9F0747|nr:hypothetical protein [Parapedobacter sp.]HWK57031.1 hypothetical protein [Parapedobacter sp.]